MRKGVKYITITIIVCISGIFASNAGDLNAYTDAPHFNIPEQENFLPEDTVVKLRTPVKKTIPEEYEDLNKNSASDLRDPENLKTIVEYDLNSDSYIIRSKVGDMDISTPLRLSPEEYQKYSMQRSLYDYFQAKNKAILDSALSGKSEGSQFNPLDLQFDLGPAEKLFGPGGVRIKSQGSAAIDIGFKTSKTDNPSLPEKSRSRTFFNFDTDVQLNMNAAVGSKINFDMNYNTEASFDFDGSKLKLAYQGEEDEIIKSIEGGNVSMNTNNSLIRGGSALFGIKSDLQFGKLRIKTIVAQQESDSRTVSSKGGAQMTDFEISVDQYDDNRHYFLGHYFRDTYDESMSKLPYISSGFSIQRIEVWVTNKSSDYGQSRNIIAFSDLGEVNNISNPQFTPSGGTNAPYNEANSLYRTIVDNYPQSRNINAVSQAFEGFIESGTDYEKIESARLLSSSEYTLSPQLGYISLRSKLRTDEVLAVAFEYTYNGRVYQVGEFSSDNSENTNECLYLKMLKGTSSSPSMPFWDLMMKNVYALNAYSIQKTRFRLDIVYQSDTTGTYIYTIPEGNIKEETLLRVMNLDRLNSTQESYPDGFFDYIEGYTVVSGNGQIIFPVVEPFGSHLRKKIGNAAIADKYVYQELYDSTLTIAKQIAEKNKFLLRGEYTGSSSNMISLGATNVARGSVVVKANGVILTENVDYVVNYSSGTVSILNENLLASNASISVSLENQSMYSMQRKTVLGTDLNYEFSKNFNMGGTVMYLSERPLTTKTTLGEESVQNMLWGLNLDYSGESQWLTNMFDKLPLLSLTQPSRFSINAEFAHLIAGHYENKYTGEYSYLDDFESSQSEYDLTNYYYWNISSTPYDDNPATALFPEASLTNNVDYLKNRSLLSWYHIDGIFTRKNSALKPSYMSDDYLSNHYIRAVLSDELFPDKELLYNENNYLNILNLAYYPNERGPYNLDADDMNSDGTLMFPEKRWGGIMRRLDQTDFETANIQYIEFWIMDPFIYGENLSGGDLYLNLGEISEDILKDEKKFFENGLPVDGDMSQVDTTVWGKVPKQQSTVYAFDNTAGTRQYQDVGFNGLSSEEEKSGGFPAYSNYLSKLQETLSQETLIKMASDPFSPLNDPGGDDFHYFRGSDYDNQQADILMRYKRFNGVEGNSRESDQNSEQYNTSSKMLPDAEDFNQDNTLNEKEKYYQYRVSLRPEDMVVGTNYIVDKRTSNVKLANGTKENVSWYQFKVPIKEYERTIGSISDFSSIRFMRMYMTGFKETTILRFGTFALVRGEWRQYEQPLYESEAVPSTTASLSVSTVNIEENSDREPVNYVLPPGVSRVTDPSQPLLRQQNEQSLSMKITNLASQDARAIYKTTNHDLRRYKRMELFVHAEKLVEDITNLQDGELSVFIRLGSDYRNNYYEYEVPLNITSFGSNARDAVWPDANKLDFRMEVLTDLKLNRNRAKSNSQSNVSYSTIYSEYDPDNTRNTISVRGNPSLSEVQIIMIGIRNNSKDVKSAEVWVNELRVSEFDESGGWASNVNMNLAISDFATIDASGYIETAGFGNLDQSVSERNLDDYSQFSLATTIQLGKLFPEKARVSLPVYYAYSKEQVAPQYNPLDQDIKLSEAISNESSQSAKDSIRSFSNDVVTKKAFAINNVSVGIRSKTPMPYDPVNFSMGYASSVETRTNPETIYETTKNFQANLGYSYTPYVKPLTPFSWIAKNNGYTKYLKNFSLNYLPSLFSFQNSMTRNYYEIQLRNLNDPDNKSNIPVSFSQNFFWDRAFEVRWNLLSNLMLNFTSGTNARIEEPYIQVNKELNSTGYEIWKDSVTKSIASLGKPMKYDQTFSATYTLPLQQIPILDWMTATASYKATYNWERGAYVDETTDIGNIIKNQRVIDAQGSLNFSSLYNKNEFLKKVNQKFNVRKNATENKPVKKKKKRPKVEREVTLSPDSGVIVQHNLLTKRVIVRARRSDDSSRYKVTHKALDFARIRITNRDSISVKLSISPAPEKDQTFLYKLGEYSARALMMFRTFRIQYSGTDGMMLPGFMPDIGDWIGQGPTSAGDAPGWGFAFGDVRRSYIDEVANKGWFVNNQDNITPAMINSSTTLTANALIEPIAGLKITLNTNFVDSRDTEIQYMYSGMPETRSGNFSMTTIGLGGFFSSSGDARKSYNSETFQKMLDNRNIIASRMNDKYSGTRYPDAGFISGTGYAGQEFNPEIGQAGLNSSDVIIPSFIAAYTNKNPEKVELTAFPSITSLLPNWNITYDGLIQLPFIKKHFKNIDLSHRYSCVYSVGGYTSFLNWVNAGIGGDLGYVYNTETASPRPSMGYEISAVTITESFNPLLGVDATLLNNITLGTQYAKNRTINLNTSSYQLVEAFADDFTVSLGFKYPEFNKLLKIKKKGDFSNDLTVRLDYTYRKALSLIRKLEDGYTQATQGTISRMIQFSADYAFSQKITMRAFYDLQINTPLVSSSSFPMSNSDYGISIQVSLDQ